MLAQTVFVSKSIDFFIGTIFFEREKEVEKERERELIWSNVHFSILFVFVHNSSAVSVCENILNECVIYHIA